MTTSHMKKIIYHTADIVLSPLTLIFAWFFKLLRESLFRHFPVSRKIFYKIGVYPIRDHYYDPLFHPKHLNRSLRKKRFLPGIDFNDEEQLKILDSFHYNQELVSIPREKSSKLEYAYNYGQFRSGDAEFFYNIIRKYKPSRLIEIGSGSSTLLAMKAIKANQNESPDYQCEHICIEPFEASWLEETGAKIIRERVEKLDPSFFQQLGNNDILFIDSSHIIRPQGDVLFEYLEVLPSLNPGVIVHIHDIFSPRDILDEWITEARFWNEQYLLEAFLTFNKTFRIIGAVNYLSHEYPEAFKAKCPVFAEEKGREPGSFWIIRE